MGKGKEYSKMQDKELMHLVSLGSQAKAEIEAEGRSFFMDHFLPAVQERADELRLKNEVRPQAGKPLDVQEIGALTIYRSGIVKGMQLLREIPETMIMEGEDAKKELDHREEKKKKEGEKK